MISLESLEHDEAAPDQPPPPIRVAKRANTVEPKDHARMPAAFNCRGWSTSARLLITSV
jgi:hypothetical protein